MWRRLWQRWKRFTVVFGTFQAKVILTLLYFTFLVPFGIVAALRGDPLRLRRGRGGHWMERSTGDKSLEEVKRQF